MNREQLKTLLQQVKNGETGIDEALALIKDMPYKELGFAKIDHHRGLRRGFPEVIYCAGKTVEQVTAIFQSLAAGGSNVLATRASAEMYASVKKVIPQAKYYHLPGVIALYQGEQKQVGSILVVCAGTSDLPVAEEAAVTAEVMGNKVERLYDVGVAGLHRLLMNWSLLEKARVLVVVAGMEGALPSVVGGLVDKPVVAVPTSVGYGAAFNGLAALLAMLNSCCAGVTVVNIDNGFGAGYTASLINKLGEVEQ
ncbi:NCAIR mutase (PurE)-related protein [Desulfohalotomaculum tongense]|uniref:nickel pincer cofactor biosynthesis protein LarB n=1 Tax=Desulforadius tongensis TaxID=1216062 RepID=UPI00195DE4C5|nr:nickel pincer cofactor biosynthesis protein LarB [Desulforadius tongensis]MBM7855315.1 NCAIR mutase (PurE)-related protein [Desulforadius tongensis]